MRKSMFGRLTALVLAGFLSLSSFQIITAYAAPKKARATTILGVSSIGTATGTILNIVTGKGAQNVIHHKIKDTTLTEDTSTIVQGFDLDKDWLVILPSTVNTVISIQEIPGGNAIAIKAGTSASALSTTLTLNTFYTGGAAANVNSVIVEQFKKRIIAPNTPIIRDVAVNGLVKEGGKIEQGGIITITPSISLYDLSTPNPANYTLKLTTDSPVATIDGNVITIDTKTLAPANHTINITAKNEHASSAINSPQYPETTYAFSFTVTKCNAELGTPVISPILANNTINVTKQNSFQFTAAAPFTLTQADCGGTHSKDTVTHDKAVSYSWSAEGLNPNIVLDSATGAFTINNNLAAGTYKIKLTCTATAKGGSTNDMQTSSSYAFDIVKDAPPKPPTTPTEPDDDDDESYEQEQREEQWKDINKAIAKANPKDTIYADLRSNPNAPARFWENLRGRNVNVEFYMGSNFTWHINGTNLKALPANQIYIPLDIETISNATISRLAKDKDIKMFKLTYNGNFYGTLKLETTVSSSYRGKNVFLYKYNPDSSKLIYKGSAKVADDYTVVFPFTSGSSYVITEKALYGETTSSGSGSSTPSASVGSSSSSVAPSSSSSISSSSSSSSSSSESSSSVSSSSSSQSSEESSKPADVTPTEPEKPKKSIPIIIPILLVVIVITLVAVFVLINNSRGV